MQDRAALRRVGVPLAALVVALALAAATVSSARQATSLSLPIRAAFYYAWYPEGWGTPPYTRYWPSLGYYDSSKTPIIRKHIKAMRYAHIGAGIYSWWGFRISGNGTTQRFPLYLQAAHGTPFKWAVYYEEEGYRNPSPAEIQSDLRYIEQRYVSDPSYLRVNGRPVVFVYAGAGDGCAMADRWKEANTNGDYVVLNAVWVDTEPQLAAFRFSDEPAFASGVRVAAADFTGDGKVDVVSAPGPGAPPQVMVTETAGAPIASFLDGDPVDRSGRFVAAGDLTGDGVPEVVVGRDRASATTADVETGPIAAVTPEPSNVPPPPGISEPGVYPEQPTPPEKTPKAPPALQDETDAVARIDVFALSGGAATPITSFDTGLGAGARVAIADLDGDGKGEIVAASGSGGGNAVEIYDGEGHLLRSFQAYAASFNRGVHVAAGDVTGDGRPDIVTASANGSKTEVRAFDANGTQLLPGFDAYPGFGGAVSVAVGDVDGDGLGDVVTGAAGGPRVRSFSIRLGRASPLESFFAFDPSRSGQIYVAAGDATGRGAADIVGGPSASEGSEVRTFGSFRDCASQPDGWHEYTIPKSGEASLGRYSFTVSPGFFRPGDTVPYLDRDPNRWLQNVRNLASSNADWQLVVSFSEWGEGTAVESAREWASSSGYGTYLDALRVAG